MKLFKSILAVMMMAVTLSLASCSSDNDGPDPDSIESLIIGTWVEENNDETEETTFMSNGKFLEITTYDDEKYSEKGTYKISKDILYMYYDGDDEPDMRKIIDINSSRMIFKYYDDHYDEFEDVSHFWYKK